MSIFDDNNYIQITKEDISDALQSSNHFDSRIQKRAFANVLGARIGIKLLSTLEIKADNFNSVYTIPSILKDMDISDIRTDNNVTVDIRVVQDENHLCIPKSQYDFGMLPDIFVFVRITPDFSAATFIGAIAPDEINKSVELDGYYFISKDTLYNEASLKKAISSGKPESNVHPSENEVVRAQSMLVNFIDGDIINNEKHYLYEILRNSDELRKFFRDFEQFELISTDLAHTEEILSDSVLDVLGAQEIYKNEDYNESFASQIDLDELAVETAADFVEDFIEDSKEDEMPDNNDIIEGEFKELADDTPIEEAGELEELPSDEELASFADNIPNLTDIDNAIDPLEEISSDTPTFDGFEGLDISSQNTDTLNEINDLNSQEQMADNSLDVSTFSDNNSDNESDFDEFSDIQQFENLMQTNDSTDNLDNNSDFDNFEEFEKQADTNTVLEDNNFEAFEFAEPEVIQDLSPLDELTETDLNVQNNDIEDKFTDNELQSEELSVQQTDSEEIDNINFEDIVDSKIEENNYSESNETQIKEPVNEAFEISESENIGSIEDLESFELPVNMDLPNLEYDENLDKLGENTQTDIVENISDVSPMSEDSQENINNKSVESIELNDIQQTLDDISQNVTFDENGNIEEINTNVEETSFEEQNVEDNTQDTHTESSSTPSDDDDMSGLEEFTVDMAAAYEQANPQVFTGNNNLNAGNQDILAYNESDFSLTDNLPQLDNLEQLTPIEQTLEPLENQASEHSIQADMPEFDNNQDTLLEPITTSDDTQTLAELDNLYTTEDLTSDISSDFSSQMETLHEDMLSSLEPETYTADTSSTQQDYSGSGYTEMEVYRPEADNSSVSEFETPIQDETYNLDTTEDVAGLNFDDLTSQADATSNNAYSDINLDDFDSDDEDEFGDLNTSDNSNYAGTSDIDIDNINIDDIDINNIDINNIDMSEFDVSDLSSIENIPDATSQPAENAEFVQNEAPQEEYVPDFNQNDENTINSLYDENKQNQNPGDAIDQSFDQNNVNTQQKTKKEKGKQKTSPLLGILLIALIVAFAFMKKDLILEKFNAQKGVSYEQDQNMPVEGETQEDIEDAKLLNEDGNTQAENQGQEQMPVGDMPGEAGGPQDAASMEQSLHQKGSMANDIPGVKEQQLPSSTPVPIATNTIKRLYWEIPQDLMYNDSIVNYLKTVGKTMKFAIQSDLLNITEMPYSNKMIVEIEIKKDGSVGDVNTTVSSGSKQIDTIVLQSVKAAIKYVKAPTSEFKNDSNRFSLIINF